MRTPEGFLYSLAPETGVATITLNRPDTLNSLTFAIYRELTDFFAALDHERDVRAVVLTGTGRAFCSGGDVEDIIGELFARDMQGLLEFTRVTGALKGRAKQQLPSVRSQRLATRRRARSCALASCRRTSPIR